MRYHNITKDDMLNGDGLRICLWVAGCVHKCQGCQNPQTWDINGGIPFDESAEAELFDLLGRDYISGITFTGGDPLHPANREEILRLAKKFKRIFPNKTSWLYSGYTWEEIRNSEIMKYIDVLVDGRYIDDLRDVQLFWRGSGNQRVIDVKQSLLSDKIVLHCQ